MKRYPILAALCGLAVLSAGTGLASDADLTRLADRDAFGEALIGARILDPEDSANFFVIQTDGTIAGSWSGRELAGEWRWDAGYFCRSLSAPRPAPEDCQEWWLGEGMVRLVRDRGAGATTDYALEK